MIDSWSEWLRQRLHVVVLILFTLFLTHWFRAFLTSEPVASWDLPGHIASIERLREQLFRGHLVFYDRGWFTGWAAFVFYAPLSQLLSVFLSLPLEIFTQHSARLAAHLILVFGCAMLPVSIFAALRPSAEALADDKQRNIALTTLAVSSGCISFWFLNHDYQWYGVGAAAVMYVGLYSQVFAWHFLFLFFGALLRILRSPQQTSWLRLAVATALLLLTHTLTAFFALALGALCLMWSTEKRGAIFSGLSIGFCLTAFWFLPAIQFGGDYVGLDIYRPTGDFFELFFRYPTYLLVQTIEGWFHGPFTEINWNYIFLMVMTVLFLSLRRLRRAGEIFPLAAFLTLLLVVFSSGFVASSIPLGLHYYRFLAYVFLLFAALLVLVPVALAVNVSQWKSEGLKWGGLSLGAALAAISVMTTIEFPHYERIKITENRGEAYVRDEQKVLEYFRDQPDKGRVFFEYATNENRFPWLGVHYLESRLTSETGFETVNGLYIQSSIAYRMAVVSANILGANTYNIPLLFTDRADLDNATLVQQLRDFGVSYVVGDSAKLLENLQPFEQEQPVHIGNYSIVHIGNSRQPEVAPAQKQILGFFPDVTKTLRFEQLEYYFYAHKELYRRFQMIKLDPDKPLPPQVVGVLVNSVDSFTAFRKVYGNQTPQVIMLAFEEHPAINHFGVRYQHNVELDLYNDLEGYLDKTMQLTSRLVSMFPEVGEQSLGAAPRVDWAGNAQTFRITGLTPGVLYRLNYSYFPYWRVIGADLYRGSEERMFFVPHEESITLTFSPFTKGVVWIGWMLTVGGMIALWRERKKFQKAA